MSPIDFWELLRLIGEQYPGLVPMLSQPGVFPIVSQAINENWPEGRLKAGLEATPYYQSTPVSARQWDVLQATDPATARQKADEMFRTVNDLKQSLGVTLDPQMGFEFVNLALREGWDANQTRYHMLASVNKGASGGGAIADNAAKTRSIAEAYGIPMADETALDYGMRLTQGNIDQSTVLGDMIAQAKNLYPALTPFLERGQSVRDYAQPYMQLAVQELGIQPNQIDLGNPKWQGIFLAANEKGEQRVRTMQEAVATLRTDAAYGYDNSANAQKQAASFAQELMSKFGAAA